MPEALFEVERRAGADNPPSGGVGAARVPAAERADIVLRVHVQPAAGRAAVVGRHGDALHVRVAAPPVGGRANAAAAGLVAELLGLKPSQVELVGGERSRSKRFRIADVDPLEVGRALDEAVARAAAGPSGRSRGGARAR